MQTNVFSLKKAYPLINIAPYKLKVKPESFFWRKKPAVLFGLFGPPCKKDGRKNGRVGENNVMLRQSGNAGKRGAVKFAVQVFPRA